MKRLALIVVLVLAALGVGSVAADDGGAPVRTPTIPTLLGDCE